MPITSSLQNGIVSAIFAGSLLLGSANAEEAGRVAVSASPASGLSIELNRAAPTDGGCRLGFVTTNRLGAALSKAAFEIVLFNPQGLIERLLVLDFGAMPDGRTKVREFNLSGAPCETIDRILVNDVSACEGDGLADGACAAGLTVSSRAGIALGL